MDLDQFKVEKLSRHLYRIVDALDVACYLVKGEKAACLLDTCTGVGNIRACVENITKLPLTVVLSHAHMDHCGGTGWFENVWMCHSELPILEIHGDLAYRCSFFSSHLGLDLKEEDFLPVPMEGYLDIRSDMELDLGGVTVQLLHAPGHTPGMICPLIPEDRALIIGDACDDNVLLFDPFSSTVGEYREQLQKLKDLKDQYDHIYGNHGVFVFPEALIDNVLDCCRAILDHTDAHIPVQMLGAEMYSACPIGEDTLRLDGKPGNVLYSEDKVK